MAGRFESKEHAFKLFNEDLKKGDFSPVMFFYGQEEYLIEWAVESLVKKYVNPAMKNIDYIKADDDSLSAYDLMEMCDTFSMVSEKRVVWAKNFEPLKSVNPKGFSQIDRDRLLEYVLQPNEGNILVFSIEKLEDKSEFVKELKKKVKTYDFDKLDRAALSAFILKRFKEAKREVGKDIINYIIEESGYFNKETEYRLFNLENDIKKILAYRSEGPLLPEDIASVLHGDEDTFIFNFLDCITGNRKDTAFSMLDGILTSGGDVFSLVGLLINQFELILDIKELQMEGATPGQIGSTLKIHEFRIKKALGFASKVTVDKIKKILVQLYEIDRNVKTGTLEPRLALELFIGRV